MIPFLRDLVLRDFWLKLFSLGLAGLIWFTIDTMRGSNAPVPSLSLAPLEKRTLYNLPVVIMSSAEDVRRFGVEPSQIDVTVQGDRKLVQNLKGNDVRVMVDLTGVEERPGLRKRVEISIPAGLSHVSVNPSEVLVIVKAKDS
jgi:YbbR domain-containing protein